MADRIILRELEDWSKIDGNDPFFWGMDLSRDENFGIHTYNGAYWTSGCVGVGRLYGADGRPVVSQGKEHVVVINSKYHMDPWHMLEKVMTDKYEYEDYVSELEAEGKFLFKIFYDQPVVRLTQDQDCNADVLYALSFINQCFELCKKGIRKTMLHQEENFTAKVRGRIHIQKNIRVNTCNGRDDRFYCRYIDFTADTIENRILKATLARCRKIIEQKFEIDSQIIGRLHYCMNALKGVRSVTIRNKDFNSVNATGLYSYYKSLLKQAKAILKSKYYSYIAEDGKSVTKSVYTIPYIINMEAVFEFYARIAIREALDADRYYLEKYSRRIWLEKGVSGADHARRGIHLMPYCIPDIIICDKATQRPVVVLDAKYKQDDRPVRDDSHQLLAYVLLTGVKKCGFVLPGEGTRVKAMGGIDYLEINTDMVDSLQYYELLLGNSADAAEVQKIFYP